MDKGKKILRFLSSMRFAVILLVLLAAVCCAGSFISQGQTYAWYAEKYSERTAGLIIALHMDDVFHSWWFALITAFLCLNLIFCNLIRLPQLVRRTKNARDPEAVMKGPHTCEAHGIKDPGALFTRLHMPVPKTVQDSAGKEVLFSAKNTAGIWGAWVCHLGVLLLIAGFGLGQMTKQEYTVYGVPGQIRQVGETSYFIEIEDFEIRRNPNGTLDQYVTTVLMRDMSVTGDSEGKRASVTVNGPASMYGYRIYQNSTGLAAKITIRKDGEVLQEDVLCAGEYIPVKDRPELLILLNTVYPDLIYGPDGMPATKSDDPVNPGYLYVVYYQNEILGMNVLKGDEEITIDEYSVTFSEPQNYTLVQVKKDSFAGLAFAGGIITLLGLMLAFYIQPGTVWAVKEPEGYAVYGYSPKGGVLYREIFEDALRKTEGGEDYDPS